MQAYTEEFLEEVKCRNVSLGPSTTKPNQPAKKPTNMCFFITGYGWIMV